MQSNPNTIHIRFGKFATKFYSGIWEKSWVFKTFAQGLKNTPVFTDGELTTSEPCAQDDLGLIQEIQDRVITAGRQVCEKYTGTGVSLEKVNAAKSNAVCDALCEKRFGMAFLLMVYMKAHATRGKAITSYHTLTGSTFERQLNFILEQVGNTYLATNIAAALFGLATLSVKPGSGGLTNHPFFP